MLLCIFVIDPRYVIRPENCSAHDGSWYWSDENQIELFNIHRSGCVYIYNR